MQQDFYREPPKRIPAEQGDLGSGLWCNPYSKAAAVMWMSSAGQHRSGHGDVATGGVVIEAKAKGSLPNVPQEFGICRMILRDGIERISQQRFDNTYSENA